MRFLTWTCKIEGGTGVIHQGGPAHGNESGESHYLDRSLMLPRVISTTTVLSIGRGVGPWCIVGYVLKNLLPIHRE